MPDLPQNFIHTQPDNWAGLRKSWVTAIQTINALSRTDTLALRPTTPDLNHIFFTTTDTKRTYVGVNGLWQPVGGGEFLNVADNGAHPSKSASFNAGALQDTIDEAVTLKSATILVPSGEYDYDTGLIQAPVSGQTHINWLGLGGVGDNGVRLNYTGTGGTALTMTNNTRYQFENIFLNDAGTGAIGLALNSLANGSNHGSAFLHNVRLAGFTTGVKIGDSDNKAASELLFGTLEVFNATTGVLIEGKTTEPMFSTNIRFLFWLSSSCTTGMRVIGNQEDNGAGVAVFGGSTSFNDLDFDFEIPGNYYLSHMRIEGTLGQLVRSGHATATDNSEYVTHVIIDDVAANYADTTDDKVALFYQPGHYTVRNSTLQTGAIEVGGFDGGAGPRKSTLEVHQNTIVRVGAPVLYKSSSNTIWNVDYRRNGNTVGEAVNMDDDRIYLIRTDGTEHEILMPNFPWSASAGTLNSAGIYTAADTTPTVIGTNYLTIANAGAVTITNFDDGVEKQKLTLKFSDANTTIQDNANVQLAGGANFVGSSDDTLSLVKLGSVWYETGRSVN